MKDPGETLGKYSEALDRANLECVQAVKLPARELRPHRIYECFTSATTLPGWTCSSLEACIWTYRNRDDYNW